MKQKVFVLFGLAALALLVMACSAPPTPTLVPSPTIPAAPTVAPTKVLPTPTNVPVPTAVPALTLDALKNAEYAVSGVASGQAKLVNGTYKEKAASGSASEVTVVFNDVTAAGDLNADGTLDAAVILVWSGGGTGTFYNLYGVINDKGAPKPTAPELLGDRIKVKSLTIQGGELIVNILKRKPTEPLSATPTVDTTLKFQVQNGKLVSTLPATPVPTVAPTRAGGVVVAKPSVTPTAAKPAMPKGSIAYHKNESGIDRVYVYNLETNVTTPFVQSGPVMDLTLGGAGTNAHLGEWSPDNSRFAYIFSGAPGNPNILRVLDLRISDPANNTRSLDSEYGLSSPTWSPDGTQIGYVRLTANGVWSVETINADGTGGRSALLKSQNEQYRGGLSWSKNGLFALAFNLNAANDVYTFFNTPNSNKTQLTKDPADDGAPAWSPDGKQIAFTSTRDGRPQIYVMNADGTNQHRVGNSIYADFSPTWSPDGKWIAFASTRNGQTDIYMMDTNGGNSVALTKTGGDHPAWSH